MVSRDSVERLHEGMLVLVVMCHDVWRRCSRVQAQAEIQDTQKTDLDCLLRLIQACGVIHKCNKRYAMVTMVTIGEETHIT
jgi:hypothetical protein